MALASAFEAESNCTRRSSDPHARRPYGRRHAVAVTPDGRRAVSGSDDQTLRLWDLESGQTLRTLEGHTDVERGANARWAPGARSRWAVRARYDRTLRVWDLEHGQTVRTLARPYGQVNALAVTPDGRRPFGLE